MTDKQKNQTGLLCVVSSPSGGGKTSVIHAVLQRHLDYKYSISATTRKKRKREIHGVDYYFLTDEQFDRYIQRDQFIEWAHVHSYRYGTLKKPIEEFLSVRQVVLLDLDVVGGMAVKRLYPDCSLLIFLAPPSEEELMRRLRGRKSESQEQIQKRLERLPMEMSYADKYDVVIVNENFNQTVNDVENAIREVQIELEEQVK